MSEKRNQPRPAPISFYLGDKQKSKERRDNLEAIAKQLGRTRSTLLQDIADGKIKLIPTESDKSA